MTIIANHTLQRLLSMSRFIFTMKSQRFPLLVAQVQTAGTDRAYRIGQNKNVTAYHLIAQHTIEENIPRLHKTKRDLADSLLSGSNISRAMTIDDLRFLVEQGENHE